MDLQLDVLCIALIMIVFDFVSGLAGAIKNNEVMSSKLREGLWHKAGYVGIIAFGYILDYAQVVADLGYSFPTVDAVCVYIIITEAVSVFENICKLNPELLKSPFGSIIATAEEDLTKLKGKTEEEDSEEK
jgi:toxin secretion/phage lysis holin